MTQIIRYINLNTWPTVSPEAAQYISHIRKAKDKYRIILSTSVIEINFNKYMVSKVFNGYDLGV